MEDSVGEQPSPVDSGYEHLEHEGDGEHEVAHFPVLEFGFGSEFPVEDVLEAHEEGAEEG